MLKKKEVCAVHVKLVLVPRFKLSSCVSLHGGSVCELKLITSVSSVLPSWHYSQHDLRRPAIFNGAGRREINWSHKSFSYE